MNCELRAESRGATQRTVVRYDYNDKVDSGQPSLDIVAEETPVALVFNGISHAVMMATPADLEELGVGFALTEGVVRARGDIYDIETCYLASGAEVQMTISQQAFHALKARRRTLAGRSGCGVCGTESLELLDMQPERVAPALLSNLAATVSRAGRELPAFQSLMHQTGGVHAAAWCGPDGAIRAVREDVGRHNALDKLIGHLALRNEADALQTGFVFMSSRASYELVRKATRMGISMLATISAPSSLAIDLAHEAGMTLVGFCRNGRCVQY